MKKGYNFLAAVIIFAVGFGASFLYHQANLDKLNDKIAQLETENQKLLQKTADNSSPAQQSKSIESKNLIDDFQLKRLVKKGLKDPVKDLRDDLIRHPELIADKGVLGGTVRFGEDAGSIILLSEKWVMAIYSDGHFEGVMLLEFDISNGKITWKAIDSFKR